MLRTITFELRRARDIVHGGRALAEHVAGIVEPKFSAALEEARSLPKYWLALFQLGIAAMIVGDRKAVIEAEKQLRRARRKERKVRRSREDAKSALYRLLLNGRSFLEAAMEPGAGEALAGLEANLGQVEALVLLRYGAEADEELSQPDFKPEAFVINGKVTTPQEYAAEIRKATEALQEAEDQLADQVRVTELKLKVKDKALEKLGKANGSCARILEELYVLAGEKFHAERLRRSSRPRRSAVFEEEDPVVLDAHFEDDNEDEDDLDPDLGVPEDDPAEDDPAQAAESADGTTQAVG